MAFFLFGLALVVLVYAFVTILSGKRLLQYQNSARIGTMVITALNLFNVPFGTIFGIAALYVLSRPEVEQLYSNISTVPSFNDTSDLTGTTYFYVVTAINAIGESEFSAEVSATPTVTSQPKSGSFPDLFIILLFLGTVVVFTRKKNRS